MLTKAPPGLLWCDVMSKSILHLLAVLILLLMVSVFLSSASAKPLMLPPLPSSFYGTVKVNGGYVPEGTTISAWINGIQYVQAQTLIYNGESVYAMDVAGDDASTPGIIEGGIQGDTIVFQIGSNLAEQTAIWQTGTNIELNLSINSLLEKIYLPLIIN